MVGTTAVLALATASGCSGETRAAGKPAPAKVLFAVAERRDVPLYVEAVSTLAGYVDADIRARVKGYLRTQNYRDGAAVKEGDLLFTIEATDYAAAAAGAQADVAQAQADADFKKVQLTRAEKLAKGGAYTEQEFDTARADAETAHAKLNASKAALQRSGLDLSYTQIRSPVSGSAGIAKIRIGNLVGQDGPTLLTTVSQVDVMRVRFPVTELDYLKAPDAVKHLAERKASSAAADLAWAKSKLAELEAKPNDPSGIDLVLADGKTFAHRGLVVAADRAIDPVTGTLQLEALFPNPEGLLRPGAFARVRLRRRDAGEQAVVISQKAIIDVQGQSSVAIIGPDDKITLKRVTLGPSVQNLRIVTSGLEGGERVVVEGTQKASDGAQVAPEPAPAPSAVPTPSASAR